MASHSIVRARASAASPKPQEEVLKSIYERDPQYWGPGVWFCLHSAAARVRDDKSFWEFCDTFLPIISNLLCETCTEHARKFAKNHHPSNYLGKRDEDGTYIGAFMWTFDLHNEANKYTKGTQWSWEEAKELFKSILTLTPEQVSSDRYNGRSAATVDKITSLYFDVDGDEEIEETEESAPIAVPQPKTLPTSLPRPGPLTTRPPTVIRRGTPTATQKAKPTIVHPKITPQATPTPQRVVARIPTSGVKPLPVRSGGCAACRKTAEQRTAMAEAARIARENKA